MVESGETQRVFLLIGVSRFFDDKFMWTSVSDVYSFNHHNSFIVIQPGYQTAT